MTEQMIVPSGCSRRDFLRGSLLTAGALALNGYAAPKKNKSTKVVAPANPAAAQMFLAGIGCGGKGNGDITEMMEAGMSLGALCDVDDITLQKKAAEVRQKFPGVRLYHDYRELLEKEKGKIHAVTVSTPDHMHAPIVALAMRMGLHVYCQKPLTHTIWEARQLRELAKTSGVVTQMGNQGSASDELRRGVEVLQAGVLGPVREVHVWTNRPIWPQGVARPAGEDPVPPHLDWNLWLGIAPFRPFKDKYPEEIAPAKGKNAERKGHVYHPFNWRGWHDFGTGALGDMACHAVNLPFRALDLGYATEVEAQVAGAMPESYPAHARVRFQYPQRGTKPPVTLWWYEGGWLPPKELVQDLVDLRAGMPHSGIYFVGEKGRFVSTSDYGGSTFMRMNNEAKLRSVTKHEACLPIPVSLPRVGNHYREWVEACVAGNPKLPYSRFEIAAYLTEMVLMGCIALRLPGKKIAWDGPNMRSPNTPEVAPLVHGTYRDGWTV
ncbi:MAG: gfo/Idh/MocA family oxidoreductase [Verrucomicrobia bacterium]|nr:MAG: gfo/Idh/MocA family oxidoreductase [Verrucomicrobiota bacterium]